MDVRPFPERVLDGIIRRGVRLPSALPPAQEHAALGGRETGGGGSPRSGLLLLNTTRAHSLRTPKHRSHYHNGRRCGRHNPYEHRPLIGMMWGKRRRY